LRHQPDRRPAGLAVIAAAVAHERICRRFQSPDIIALFTDGLNTLDHWYADGSSTSTQVDARMSALCTNIKATGATVFIVQIDTGGAGPLAVLPACVALLLADAAEADRRRVPAVGVKISKLRVAG
jgi:hypothetical protein